MIKELKILRKEILPISLILILVFSRLIPHPPNFTPVIAVAIMGSYFFRNIYFCFATLLASMFLADIILGFYENMIFVYLSLLIVALSMYSFSKKINFKNLFAFGFFGSVIFFLVSNFGFWLLSDLYSKDFSGLIQAYIMGIPFFKNTLISTLIFSYASLIVYKTSNKYFVVS